MESQLTYRSITNINHLLPISFERTIDGLAKEIIFRSKATTARQVARSLKATIQTKNFTGSLQGLCIPIKHGEKAARGLKYAIVVDPRKCTQNEDVDPWVFLVGHEIGHIVSNTFDNGITLGINHSVENWCSEFGRSLGRQLSISRR